MSGLVKMLPKVLSQALEITPEFSKGEVNRAGEKIRCGNADEHDMRIVENWRAAHNHILNTFQASLRRRARESGVRSPFQRIKRLDTIEGKLRRFPKMELARMHDIVGCRVVFDSIDDLRAFRAGFNRSRFSHRRHLKKREDGSPFDAYDYITNPKDSGYRGIHDVFEYRAKQSGPRKATGGERWNGLHIEIQYRTAVQHAWATAVEICDKYTDNHGKFSNAPADYLRYFTLASEVLARRFENMTACHPELTAQQIISEFRDLEEQHGMLKTLRGIQPSDKQFATDRHTLLILNEKTDVIAIETFSDFRKAIAKYFAIEREKAGHPQKPIEFRRIVIHWPSWTNGERADGSTKLFRSDGAS